MIKNSYNGDYIKGMKLLLERSREQNFNIRQCQWIPSVSKLLSEHNLCYKFWYNVVEQNNLSEIPYCKTWYDIMHGYHCLFYWCKSDEGVDYWLNGLYKMLGVECYDDEECDCVLQNMKL